MGKIRRDKGDGSIFQLKDGTWVAELKYGKKANGKPNAKRFTGKTESEVKKKLKQFKNELVKNDYIQVKKTTVSEYMDRWLYGVIINKLKPKSFDAKENTLHNHVYKYIGDIQINSLSANDIQKMINGMVAKNLSYSAIKKAFDAVNGCFKSGIIKGEILKNPCVGVALPENKKVDISKIKFFDDAQIAAICAESVRKYRNGVAKYRLGYAIIILMYTGMRIGELLALKWSDIDFDKKTISIFNSFVQVKNRADNAKTKFIMKEQDSTKSRASNRTIPIRNKVIEALNEVKKINANSTYVR